MDRIAAASLTTKLKASLSAHVTHPSGCSDNKVWHLSALLPVCRVQPSNKPLISVYITGHAHKDKLHVRHTQFNFLFCPVILGLLQGTDTRDHMHPQITEFDFLLYTITPIVLYIL